MSRLHILKGCVLQQRCFFEKHFNEVQDMQDHTTCRKHKVLILCFKREPLAISGLDPNSINHYAHICHNSGFSFFDFYCYPPTKKNSDQKKLLVQLLLQNL